LRTGKNVVDLSKIPPREKKMINGIIRMKERPVGKVMVPKNEVVALAHDTRLDHAVAVYQQRHFSRYPVFYRSMDQIVGMLYVKDIFSFWNDHRDHAVVEFVRLPYFVYEDRPALNVFLELQRMKLSLAIVIDEFGGVSGIVTVEDLIEEIVGEIEDEFNERKKPMIEKISDRECYLNTRMEIDDFAERFGVNIDEEDVSTIGGLILKHADRIPRVGEEIQYRNFLFTIVEATRRKINKVRVRIL
jgi:CBS domain containing-hemolysin-like protein